MNSVLAFENILLSVIFSGIKKLTEKNCRREKKKKETVLENNLRTRERSTKNQCVCIYVPNRFLFFFKCVPNNKMYKFTNLSLN